MAPARTLILYCAVVMAASFLGGTLPERARLTHTRRQILFSFAGGFMLGVAILHLLPHAAAQASSWDSVARWCLAGLVVTFVLLRIFHVHASDVEAALDRNHARHASRDHGGQGHAHSHGHGHPHGHAHPHGHGDSHGHHGAADVHDAAGGHAHTHPPSTPAHWMSGIGLALGFGLHSFIDGIALAAAVLAERFGGAPKTVLGLGAFLAITLHKPLDALVVTSVMRSGGWPARARHLVNGALAAACPLGAWLLYTGAAGSTGSGAIVGSALAFTAGVFLCVSLSDLLPEVRFHAHDRVVLSLALAAGLGLAVLVGLVEPEAAHAPAGIEAPVVQP